VARLVEGLCYKPEGRGFDCRWCYCNFSLTQSFRPYYGPRVDSASNRNEYQEYFLGGKGGRCVGLNLPNLCADCHEIWEPQPPGTLRACPGLYRDCVIFTFYDKENDTYLKQNLCPSIFCFVIGFDVFLYGYPVIQNTWSNHVCLLHAKRFLRYRYVKLKVDFSFQVHGSVHQR
jgi:hypothetical protein